MKALPNYIDNLDDGEAQPIFIRRQGSFVAVIQWDGCGEFQHWVLIPVKDLEDVITKIKMEAA